MVLHPIKLISLTRLSVADLLVPGSPRTVSYPKLPLAFDNADRVLADDGVDADEGLQADAEPGLSPLQIADGVCGFGELDDLLQRLLITFLRARPAGHDDEEAVRVSVEQVQARIAVIDQLERADAGIRAELQPVHDSIRKNG